MTNSSFENNIGIIGLGVLGSAIAENFINKFEYKTEGLMLSDTYFLHLALLNNFYEKN